MSREDFQQNNEHGGYPIVVKLDGNVITRLFQRIRSFLCTVFPHG